MEANAWKTTFLGVAARASVSAYVLSCLSALEAGMAESVAGSFARSEWREGLDLAGVPRGVVARTERLLADAADALVGPARDTDFACGRLLEILDLW